MNLAEVAATLVQPGKGILAADESTSTIGKRLAKYDIANTEENRRQYRELFITADGIASSLSGVILYKETLQQLSSVGKPFVDCLRDVGVLSGVKVDEGLEPLPATSGENHTKGLHDLASNCEAYARQGARFSKWRAALCVSTGLPSVRVINTNAEELAEYATISQAKGMVPIVEPEILIDGSHGIEISAETASRVLQAVIAKLWEKGVQLEACLLKLQMVMPGSEAAKVSAEEIAERTLQVLRRTVPPAIPGIVFLSGGQSEEEATINLNAINQHARASGPPPWGLTFSYGRSLQASVLELWSQEKTQEAKLMASALAAANASASTGQYKGPHPSIRSGVPLKEHFRGWQ